MEITFYGATESVTGSKFLLHTDYGIKILIDCGLFQGETGSAFKNDKLPFDSSTIDYVFLTHAHIDHSGLLPMLVKNGFKGKLYCTSSTLDLLEILLEDSANIQLQDLRYVNKTRAQKGLEPIEPIYDVNDVKKLLDKVEVVDINSTLNINNKIFVNFFPNGHILGSVAIHFSFRKKDNSQVSVLFTGDVGRPKDTIFPPPVLPLGADYVICESTYGNRLHSPQVDLEVVLRGIIEDTCLFKKGKIIIPAFSVDRTQEIIYAIDRMDTHGTLPPIKVYVDSPLSTKATRIMDKHRNEFNKEILEYICRDGAPFEFKNLIYITDVEESKALNNSSEPCVIISASGMADAGRVKHHIKNNLHSDRNLILLVGYATPHSLAWKLRSGVNPLRIFGEYYEANARVQSLDFFSAHADYLELIEYLKSQDPKLNKSIFLVHGSDDAKESFALKLNAEGFENVIIPEFSESFEL